jgi:hypothetical protein
MTKLQSIYVKYPKLKEVLNEEDFKAICFEYYHRGYLDGLYKRDFNVFNQHIEINKEK